MAVRKGADLITEYLVKEKIPYVFGICGHGNVGLLDSLYRRRDRIKLVSPRHEQVAGAHGRRLFPRAPRAGRDADLLRPRLLQHRHAAGGGAVRIPPPSLAITANVPTQQFNRSPFQEINRHFQADFPNIIRPVVKRSFQPTRVDMLPLALRQATTTMLSGGPARERRHPVQRLPGGGRRRGAAGLPGGYNAQRSGASRGRCARGTST